MTARSLLLAGLLIAACSGGCSSDSPAPLLQDVAPTPTPLALESRAPSAPPSKATKKPTPAGTFYKPPGWDGYSDVNCSDFDTQAHAESFFKGTGGSTTNDPYHLDNDHDGKACETLP